MKKAGIAEPKNNLSRYINYVKGGETVLVLDRKVPVARITPVAQPAAAGHKMTDEERLDYLESIGAVRRGKGDMREWLRITSLYAIFAAVCSKRFSKSAKAAGEILGCLGAGAAFSDRAADPSRQ